MKPSKATVRRSALSDYVLAAQPDFYQKLPPTRVKHLPRVLAQRARLIWEVEYGESPEAYLAANRDESGWLRSRWIAAEIASCDPRSGGLPG